MDNRCGETKAKIRAGKSTRLQGINRGIEDYLRKDYDIFLGHYVPALHCLRWVSDLGHSESTTPRMHR